MVQKLSYELRNHDYDAVQVSIHPPYTDLRSIQTLIDADRMHFHLGAQNCHTESSGAFTGEVSPAMLQKLEVGFVIVGHSERRSLSGETNEIVAAKAKSVFAHGMVPIVCVGETLEERESGRAESVVEIQVTGSLADLSKDQLSELVIAYEPVWAIGTGLTPTIDEINHTHEFIKNHNSKFNNFKVLYGGSVKSKNVKEIIKLSNVDGALIGGASLKSDEFTKIIED